MMKFNLNPRMPADADQGLIRNPKGQNHLAPKVSYRKIRDWLHDVNPSPRFKCELYRQTSEFVFATKVNIDRLKAITPINLAAVWC
jgi:hypothetical protein